METVFDYQEANGGMLPRWSDEAGHKQPWTYQGWILPYIIRLHDHLFSPFNRWSYYLDTLTTGALLPHPIPELHFAMEGDSKTRAAMSNLKKCLDIVWQDSASWSGLNDFVRWLAFGCGVTREESRFSAKTQEALYRTFNAQPMLEAPHDYFGWLYSERLASGWNPNAFFPTPHTICQMMTLMNFGDDKQDQRALTVCDPCVGTGRMLLFAGSRSLRLYGMDIDPLCVLATKINGVLFCPWLTFGVPDAVFQTTAPTIDSVVEVPASIREADKPEEHFVGWQGQGCLFGDLDRKPARRKKT